VTEKGPAPTKKIKPHKTMQGRTVNTVRKGFEAAGVTMVGTSPLRGAQKFEGGPARGLPRSEINFENKIPPRSEEPSSGDVKDAGTYQAGDEGSGYHRSRCPWGEG